MKSKYLLTILIIGLLLTACGPPAAGSTAIETATEATLVPQPEPTSQPTPTVAATFEEAPCPIDLPPGAVEGEHIVCGFVDVPETRFQTGGSPSSATIRLAVAVISSADDDPAPDALVMLAGGPGQSALSAFIPLFGAPGMEGFYADREIVLIEQRGTQYSTPFLTCEEMRSFKLETMGQILGDEEEEAQKLNAWSACRDRLVEAGINLAAYNSLENAADIVAVVDALGYDTFNLYGGSYGSLLAQHILRDYPERVRSVVLDGVSPLRHAPNMLYKAHSTDRALRLLFTRCQEDKICNENYPDLEKVYFGLVDRLNEAPASLHLTNPDNGEVNDLLLTGDKLVVLTRDLLYITSVLPDLPQAFYGMIEGDFSLLELIQAAYLYKLNLADGMYNSVVCTELADFKPSDMADASGLYPKVAEAVEDLIDEVILQPCQVWGVKHLGAQVTEPVTGDTPILLLSGEFDPTVPPEMAQVAAEGLQNTYLYTFPGVAHGVLGSEPCAVTMMLAFFDDPSSAPDASCMNELPGLVFRYPPAGVELVAFSDEEIGLGGLVPAGWKEVGPGAFVRGSSATDPVAIQMVLDPQKDVKVLLADISKALGQAENPAPVAERQANGLSWSLYSVQVQGYPVNFGLAQTENGTLILIVQSTVDEREECYETILLPMIDALVPLSEEASAGEGVDDGEITLEPFTDDTMGIHGVAPSGWIEAGPGTFTRSQSDADITVLLMQAAPAKAQDLLNTLASQLGLSDPPQSVGERQVDGMTWVLYEIEIQNVYRDIALAEQDGQAYIVILRSDTDERELLYEEVFLPAVDGLAKTD